MAGSKLYQPGIDFDSKRLEASPVTGTGKTGTILDTKQGGMIGTLDMCAIQIEKPVRHPVQRCAGVRAPVQVRIYAAGLPHYKDSVQFPGLLKGESTAVTMIQLVQPADCYG
jgi:hypothetical protein